MCEAFATTQKSEKHTRILPNVYARITHIYFPSPPINVHLVTRDFLRNRNLLRLNRHSYINNIAQSSVANA